jgi:hypothetical protein
LQVPASTFHRQDYFQVKFGRTKRSLRYRLSYPVRPMEKAFIRASNPAHVLSAMRETGVEMAQSSEYILLMQYHIVAEGQCR